MDSALGSILVANAVALLIAASLYLDCLNSLRALRKRLDTLEGFVAPRPDLRLAMKRAEENSEGGNTWTL